jgi:glutamate racemase
VTILPQGEIVATSLKLYLQNHPEIEKQCSRQGEQLFYTTDSTEDFDNHASIFFGKPVKSSHLSLS